MVSNSDDLNIVINEIEMEAKKLASSVDTLTENLTGILHSVRGVIFMYVYDSCKNLCESE